MIYDLTLITKHESCTAVVLAAVAACVVAAAAHR
jgi:hypothetical protein